MQSKYFLTPDVSPTWSADSREFLSNHYEIPWTLIGIYLLHIVILKRFMKDRKGINVQAISTVWYGILAVFSIIGSINIVPLLFVGVDKHGISGDLCNNEVEDANPWVLFFCLSKIPELFDTSLIILQKKKKLSLLHWYHHAMTLYYCWDAWAVHVPNGGWFAAMNLLVHSIMYSYYCIVQVFGRLPNFLRMVITSLQILQMVCGTSFIVHNLMVCPTEPRNLWIGLFMYVSYAVLFGEFFVDNYIRRKTKPLPASDAKKTE